MAHLGSKGYYVAELKKAGILKHPREKKSLKKYNTTELRALFFDLVEKK